MYHEKVQIVSFLIIFEGLFAQSWEKPYRHISADHDHSSNNCYGYALGRAEGKTSGDCFCDPVMTLAQGIPECYTFSTNILNVGVGDILAWGSIFLNGNPHGYHNPHGHVAYVVYVPSNLNINNIGDIKVDQVPGIGGSEETVYVSEITNQGDPVGFFDVLRGKTIRATLANDFEGEGGGVVLLRNPLLKDDHQYHEKDHPHHEYCSILGTQLIDIKAVDYQEINSQTYEFSQWQLDGVNYSNNIELLLEQISHSVVYEAIFTAYVEPLTVDVSGPTILIGHQFDKNTKAPQYHATGTWEADADGGIGNYDYQWYYYGYYGWTEYSGEIYSTMTKTLYYDPDGHDLKCVVIAGNEQEEDQIHVYVTGDEPFKKSSIPQTITLDTNYPNPFNPTTNIKFELSKSQKVEISVYSISGKKVRTLVNNTMEAGYHTINWNATDDTGTKVTSGVYIYQMKCNGKIFTNKMILAK